MVQRNLPNKLSIQVDHVKRENLLMNLRSSSLQHHDHVKTKRGVADLKKKMKKSGSIKRVELESPRGPNMRRHVKQPGKPPPSPALVLPPGGATLQQPNYMKPTTSSDARKEQSQVSIRSPQTSPDSSKFPRKSSKNSKLSLDSSNKATKTLAKTTSLKMMRTLTKNPSFKPVRASVRKCSPVVVLCENLDVQKATCSSTLKDCKFPAYLTLNHGGTESEGTSTIKVCPYTYCYLNGHHHAPLAPLKCFLSARRRMLKTQRGIKLGCLSPRRVKPTADGPIIDEKSPMQDDLKSSRISPLTEEEHTDFFIEIYSEKKEDTAEHTGIDRSASHSSINDLLPSVDERDEAAVEDQEEQVLEAHSDGPICYDVDTHETLDQNGDANSSSVGTTYFSEQNQEVKVAEASPPSSIQEERKLGFFSELDSESSDMDWETGHQTAMYLDDDCQYSQMDVEPDLEGSKVESCIIHDELIFNSENKGGCFDESLAIEVTEGSFDEESFNSYAFSSSDDTESTGSSDHLESLNNVKTSASVEVPEEKPEPACDNKNQILFECNQTPRIDLRIDDQASDLLKDPVDETVTCGEAMSGTITEVVVLNQTSSDEGCQVQAENHLSDEYQTSNMENQDHMEKESNHAENITLSPMDPANEPHLEVAELKSTEGERHTADKTENAANPETEDSALARAMTKCKTSIQDLDDIGLFNPRGPNFLPLEPDPEAEKVDLRHQELDERKNAEEWMVDFALRQTVTKLGPARKRKVALLVEAFEKVTPTTKYELHMKHRSAFEHARPIQTCN